MQKEDKAIKKIVWISPYMPYDTVAHAGGKNHNYYIKSFQKTGRFEITLFTLVHSNELKKIDVDKYGIDCKYKVVSDEMPEKSLRLCMNLSSEYSPFDSYYGVFSNYQRHQLIKLIEEEYMDVIPDVIILQWTQCLLLLPIIKKYYNNIPIVGIEEDVAFLGMKRKYDTARSVIGKWFYAYRYERLKKKELAYINNIDLVVVNNEKDKALLESEGVSRDVILRSAIYYDSFKLLRKSHTNNLIFYGALNRTENYLSLKWFVENVMPQIPEFNLWVVGGGASKNIKKFEQHNIKIWGFVDNPSPLFEKSLCMVVPLVLGAGIKVKVLEAFKMGLPVITNDIGIEGIDAIDGKEFLYALTADDYVKKIRYLWDNREFADSISKNEVQFVNDNFNNDELINNFIEAIDRI